MAASRAVTTEAPQWRRSRRGGSEEGKAFKSDDHKKAMDAIADDMFG
jgi:hypothetical protein